MSAAALTAVAVDAALAATGPPRRPAGGATRPPAGGGRPTPGPWMVATGEDLRYPGTRGGSNVVADRLVRGTSTGSWAAAAADPVVNAAFFDVVALMAAPTSLLRPAIVDPGARPAPPAAPVGPAAGPPRRRDGRHWPSTRPTLTEGPDPPPERRIPLMSGTHSAPIRPDSSPPTPAIRYPRQDHPDPIAHGCRLVVARPGIGGALAARPGPEPPRRAGDDHRAGGPARAARHPDASAEATRSMLSSRRARAPERLVPGCAAELRAGGTPVGSPAEVLRLAPAVGSPVPGPDRHVVLPAGRGAGGPCGAGCWSRPGRGGSGSRCGGSPSSGRPGPGSRSAPGGWARTGRPWRWPPTWWSTPAGRRSPPPRGCGPPDRAPLRDRHRLKRRLRRAATGDPGRHAGVEGGWCRRSRPRPPAACCPWRATGGC